LTGLETVMRAGEKSFRHSLTPCGWAAGTRALENLGEGPVRRKGPVVSIASAGPARDLCTINPTGEGDLRGTP